MDLAFDEETQARPADEFFRTREDRPDLQVPYEALPSLELRPGFAAFEGEDSGEHDPVTELVAARDTHHVRARQGVDHRPRGGDAGYGYEDPYGNGQPRTEKLREGEGSGARERPSPVASYAAPVPAYDEVSDSSGWPNHGPNHVPAQAPNHAANQAASRRGPGDARVDARDGAFEQEHRPASPFVVGVQPVSAQAVQAGQRAHGRHAQPEMRGHATPQPMQPMQVSGGGSFPPPAMASGFPTPPPPSVSGGTVGIHSAPGPSQAPMAYGRQQIATGPQAAMMTGQHRVQPLDAKPLRIGWFVAGAAFGIAFAFFATGFFSGKSGRDEASFPPPAPLPVQAAPTTLVQQPVVAPVVPATMATAPVAPAMPTMTAMTPQSLPAAPPTVVQAPVMAPVAPAPAAPPPTPVVAVAPAPAAPAPVTAPAAPAAASPEKHAAAAAPRAPRTTGGSRRSSTPAPTSAGPKPMYTGAGSNEPESGSAGGGGGGGDIGDLLGAALKP